MTAQPYPQIIITPRVYRLLQKIRRRGGSITCGSRTSNGFHTVMHDVRIITPAPAATAALTKLHHLITAAAPTLRH